jgi:hypothetical protein
MFYRDILSASTKHLKSYLERGVLDGRDKWWSWAQKRCDDREVESCGCSLPFIHVAGHSCFKKKCSWPLLVLDVKFLSGPAAAVGLVSFMEVLSRLPTYSCRWSRAKKNWIPFFWQEKNWIPFFWQEKKLDPLGSGGGRTFFVVSFLKLHLGVHDSFLVSALVDQRHELLPVTKRLKGWRHCSSGRDVLILIGTVLLRSYLALCFALSVDPV